MLQTIIKRVKKPYLVCLDKNLTSTKYIYLLRVQEINILMTSCLTDSHKKYCLKNVGIGGSVVEFSPATRVTRVRFPADAMNF